MLLRRLIAGLALVLGGALGPLGGPAAAQPAGPPTPVHAVLVGQTDGAAPGSVLYVAVDQRMDQGWHTYWRNPGDAGEATTIAWSLPAGWRAGDIVWPAPERLPLGPLMNYGYRGEAMLPVPIEVPADAKPGTIQHIAAKASFLACADVCVPEDVDLALDVPVTAAAPPVDARWGGPIARTLALAPKPSGLRASFQAGGGRLRLAVVSPDLAARATANAYFYPYQGGVIDQSAPQRIDLGAQGMTFDMPLSPNAHGAAPAEVQGVVETGEGSAYEVSAAPGPPPAGVSGLGAPKPPQAAMTFGPALGLAFIGGLLLNLMPCVLPVLSMKAAAFAGHGGEAGAARIQGLAFLAGVMATFLALAGLLIAARAGGAAIGWGFQLQSPTVSGALALAMLAAALNLSGVYELGASLQGLGGSAASRATGLAGAALTGVLAVAVAAPCTAPFMGGAVGFALTQPAAVGLAVFAALGLGFALPMVALAFSPALIRRLPRPGGWMTALRQALAFPMYGAAAWLAWVVSRQVGAEGLATLFAAALALAVGAWLWGAAQARQADGKSWRAIAVPAILAAALAVALVARTPAPQGAQAAPATTEAGLQAVPYSAGRLAALRAAGAPVLVNFTAAWCVTCQVNERVALDAAEVAAAFRRTGTVYMVGDWTGRDAAIAQALAEQGRAGVPLYLVYGAGGGAPRVLPQLLTPGLVAEAVEAAAIRPPAAVGR